MIRAVRLRGVLAALLLLIASLVSAAPSARAQSTGGSFHGADAAVLGPTHLHAGVVVVRGRSNGPDNFTLWLVLPDQGRPVADDNGSHTLMIDAVGPYDGAAAEVVPTDGDYYLALVL